MMNDNDEIQNLIKAFDNLSNAAKVTSNDITNPIRKLDSKDLANQLKNEAAKNFHKRRERLFDFLTDSLINFMKSLAIFLPVVIGLLSWGWAKHNGYPDVANEIIVLSKMFFNMFIGFLLGNFLNSLFKKNN